MGNRLASVFSCALGIAIAFGIATGARAEWKPERPVRILLPFPPGGAADGVVRAIAAEVSKDIGQSIIIENKPGASGKVVYNYLKGVAGDGHTLGYVSSTGAVLTAVTRQLDFDLLKDFKPITVLAEFSGLLATNSETPVKDFREFVAYAKARPGKLAFGSYGAKGQDHLDYIQLMQVAGIDMIHVPFKGEAPVVNALLGNQVQLGRIILSPKQFADTGKLKILASFGNERHPDFPDVKTLEEQGFNYATKTWSGLAAAPGTSDEAVAFWNKAFVAALKKPAVIENLKKLGFRPRGTPPEEVTKELEHDIETYRKAVAIGHIELD